MVACVQTISRDGKLFSRVRSCPVICTFFVQEMCLCETRFVGVTYGRYEKEMKVESQASEASLMRQKLGRTKWDQTKNEVELEELEMSPILDYMHQSQNNWRQHVN